jgi:hypothetical protein
MILFVYVQGLRGPEPQIWPERPYRATGKVEKALQEIELPDNYAELPIDQLVTLYPYQGAYDVT